MVQRETIQKSNGSQQERRKSPATETGADSARGKLSATRIRKQNSENGSSFERTRN